VLNLTYVHTILRAINSQLPVCMIVEKGKEERDCFHKLFLLIELNKRMGRFPIRYIFLIFCIFLLFFLHVESVQNVLSSYVSVP
jgi:hypothetical protein